MHSVRETVVDGGRVEGDNDDDHDGIDGLSAPARARCQSELRNALERVDH